MIDYVREGIFYDLYTKKNGRSNYSVSIDGHHVAKVFKENNGWNVIFEIENKVFPNACGLKTRRSAFDLIFSIWYEFCFDEFPEGRSFYTRLRENETIIRAVAEHNV